MAEPTCTKAFERLGSTRRFRHSAMIALLAAVLGTGLSTAAAQVPEHGSPVYVCPKSELDLKVERSAQMWHFPVDFHTRQGGPHGLERDHSRAV